MRRSFPLIIAATAAAAGSAVILARRQAQNKVTQRLRSEYDPYARPLRDPYLDQMLAASKGN